MNATLKLPRDQIESLRPRDVQYYLSSRGWVVVADESSPDAAVFRHPAMGDVVLLPLRNEFGDYALRMADIVQALAALENRPIWEVLNDLSGPPSDVLRLRVTASETILGNLPLEEGIQLLRGGREMLLSSACSVIRPQAFHPEKTLKDASAFIKKCRLGQTERGSFVATIITPVPPKYHQQMWLPSEDGIPEEREPFARRVTTGLMTSLNRVDDALKTAQFDPILKGIAEGVSANLCDALVTMKPPGDQSRLDIRMSWSRLRPGLPEGVPAVVTFARNDFEMIGDAGRLLRERARPQRQRFEGKILALQSEVPSLFDDLVGKITLRTDVRGQTIRIKVVLNQEDYRRACDAHRDEKRVAVTGIIHHDVKVRVYELSEPRDFEILDDL